MTNPQTDPEVELEEGEIEDDGCEVETESALGKSDCSGIESSKVDTKPEENVYKEKDKSSNGIKSSKKTSRAKEKVSEYNDKKKYASEVKSTDWRDMFYTDLDEGEDDGMESDTYHQELEEIRKRLTGDIYGSCNSDSPSGDEDDRMEDKKPRKRHEDGEEQIIKFPRHHSDKKSKITCKFFLDGNCMKGSDCLYSHDKSKIRERDICKSFKAMGFCSYGKKCRYIHLDITKAKKETPSRKRRSSSDKDESEQPPKKKIPSLLELDVVPKGQSEEDVGKALMMAAKRSITFIQRSKTRKTTGTSEHSKKTGEKMSRNVTHDKDESDKEEQRSDEDVDEKNEVHDKEDFGDKDERQLKNYHDIDERQNLNVHVSDNSTTKMEEEPFKVQPPANNGINVRALLGDAPAPPNNGPSRVPLLGNAPTNFNIPFPQYPRPPMRPSPSTMAMTQTLGLMMNQNMGSMPHPQSRMMNPGLLPHPTINQPRGSNGGFNPRPFGPPGIGINNNISPAQFLGSQNLNQMPNNSSLLPLPMNLNREPPFPYANSPLSMPGQFPPEEAKLQQGEMGGSNNMGLVGEQRVIQSVEQCPANNQFGNCPPFASNPFDFFKCTPVDQIMNPLKPVDSSQKSRSKEEFESFPPGYGDISCQDRDMRFNATPFFDPTKAPNQSFGFSSEETKPLTTSVNADINASFEPSPMSGISQQKNDKPALLELPFVQPERVEATNCEDKNEIVTESNNEAQQNQSSSATHESSSISLSVANEVTFDCKLKGPYCLQKIDLEVKITLPDFIDPTDPDRQLDPRVVRHKDDPRKPVLPEAQSSNLVSKPETSVSVAPPPASTMASFINTATSSSVIIQTRDPRLLKRNRKEMEKNSQPAAEISAPAETQPQSESVKTLEPLEAFIRRYSNFPVSDTDKNNEPAASDAVKTDVPEQEVVGSNRSENANASIAKKSYQNLIVKKSSKQPGRAKSGSDTQEDDAEEPKSKRAKTTLEFQSPLMSPVYSAPAMQYGLPPNGRFRESQKSSEQKGTSQESDQVSVPEASPFLPTPGFEVSSEGCVKSIFNNIDPTASPFL